MAKDSYTAGVKAASKGQWEKARAAFLEAYRIKQHFQIAINLGQAELKVGQYRGAAEHLSYYLREAQGVSDEERRKAETMLAEAQAKVGRLRISVSAAGAEVLVDGVSMGKTPLADPVFVEPGSRVVEARLEGGRAAKETATVAIGGEVKVSLQLGKGAAGAGAAGGAAGAGAAGGLAGSSGTSGGSAGAGASNGSETGTGGGGINKTWVIAGSSVAATTAVMGIVFISVAQAEKSASRTAGTFKHFYQLQDLKVAFAWVSLVSFVISGATAAATTIYALPARRPPKPKSSVSTDIVLGSQGIGVTLTKTW